VSVRGGEVKGIPGGFSRPWKIGSAADLVKREVGYDRRLFDKRDGTASTGMGLWRS
jgi:hypothetical protein